MRSRNRFNGLIEFCGQPDSDTDPKASSDVSTNPEALGDSHAGANSETIDHAHTDSGRDCDSGYCGQAMSSAGQLFAYLIEH